MDEQRKYLLYQVRSNSLVTYYDFIKNTHPRSEYSIDMQENFKNAKTYSGDMKLHSRRRMKRAIECLYMISENKKVWNQVLNKFTKFKLSHLTLTLSASQFTPSQQLDYKKLSFPLVLDIDRIINTSLQPNYIYKISDKQVYKKLLQPFLLDCKRKFGMKNYVWKAEKQENGNIHYHILSDMYYNYERLRERWNQLQYSLGFIQEFRKKHNHSNPNSIDIHYVHTSGDLVKYLMKYVSKNQKYDQKIEGKVWDTTKLIKSFKYYSTDLSYQDEEKIGKLIQEKCINRFEQDYFSIYNFKDQRFIKELPDTLKDLFRTQFTDLMQKDSYNSYQKRIEYFNKMK